MDNGKQSEDLKLFKKKLRKLFSDFTQQEGCSCCRGNNYESDKNEIGKVLGFKKYKDGSGYDFNKH